MKNWGHIVSAKRKTINLSLDVAAAKRLGFSILQQGGHMAPAERAARRGLRWLRSSQRRSDKDRPPSHIARNLRMIKVAK